MFFALIMKLFIFDNLKHISKCTREEGVYLVAPSISFISILNTQLCLELVKVEQYSVQWVNKVLRFKDILICENALRCENVLRHYRDI